MEGCRASRRDTRPTTGARIRSADTSGEASGREQFFLNHVAVTYDLIFEAMLEAEDVAGFFRARGGEDFDGDGRVTAGDIIYNIHRNLFAYAYEFLDRTLPIAGATS